MLGPAATVALCAACSGDAPDAYGTFEADEVAVSAEADGRLLRFDASEGEILAAGASIGLVDTMQAVLELRELAARLEAARSGTTRSETDVRAVRAELAAARSDVERTERLYADSAATRQQLDAARARAEVLEARLAGARSGTTGSGEEAQAIEAQVARLEDRLARSRITNPVPGTVLASFADAGEFVRTGQVLYRIAALDTLTLRAYVDETQLADLRIGQPVTVRFDDGDELASTRGRLTWIAAEAEFTPTPIQTREERTDLVYALEIRVPNPGGRLKIGMPADVEFGPR